MRSWYLPEHNARFAQGPPRRPTTLIAGPPSRVALDRMFQLEETRVLSDDWAIRYATRYVQVARQSPRAPARSTVLVRENASGAIESRYRERLMKWTEIAAPVKPPLAPGGRRCPPPHIVPLGRVRTIPGVATPAPSTGSAR